MTAVIERPEVQTTPARGLRRRRWVLLFSVSAAVLAVRVNVEPLRDGGFGGVLALDADMVVVTPPASETVYVADFKGGDTVRVVFALENRTPLPVRVERIWTERPTSCGWAPEQRHLSIGPLAGSGDAPRETFAPFTLTRGEIVGVELTGASVLTRDASSGVVTRTA